MALLTNCSAPEAVALITAPAGARERPGAGEGLTPADHRRHRHRPVGPGPSPGAGGAGRAPSEIGVVFVDDDIIVVDKPPRTVVHPGGALRVDAGARPARPVPQPRTWARSCARGWCTGLIYRAIPEPPHQPRVRQHAHAGRAGVSRSFGASTRPSFHRAASWLARQGAPPQGSRPPLPRARIRAVVATSTLDLGIDWGDVDLVINIGAPRAPPGSYNALAAPITAWMTRQALLVPANRFEVLECRAALDAAEAGEQDCRALAHGLARCPGSACARHGLPGAIRAAGAVRRGALGAALFGADAGPLRSHRRFRFDRRICAEGLRALRAAASRRKAASCAIAHPRIAQQYRLNAGTIVEAPMIKVRLVGRRKPRKTGAPEVNARRFRWPRAGRGRGILRRALSPGMTFIFAGETLRFEGMVETEAFVSRAPGVDAMIPSYDGGKFPLSTHLAKRVRAMLADPSQWRTLPTPVAEWLWLPGGAVEPPRRDDMLVETFARRGRHYLVAYPFEGRLAHQTLGMLLTRRLDRIGARPLGFVANDYGLAVWGLEDISAHIAAGTLSLADLFAQDMLGDDLDAWLAESNLMKRTFRNVAIISGLIERRHPSREKSGRQVTISTDLIYDVLRRHDPGHILLEAAWEDAATGLLDIARLGAFLARIEGRIRHQSLDSVSPLSVPILLEIGVEAVSKMTREDLLRDAARELIAEATGQQ